MTHLRSRLQVFGAVAIAAGLVWGSGMLVSDVPQSERLRADVHSARVVDYDPVFRGAPIGPFQSALDHSLRSSHDR